MNATPIFSIKMVPAGVELVLAGLNKLPREVADELYKEVEAQYGFQLLQFKSLQLSKQSAGEGQQDQEGKSE